MSNNFVPCVETFIYNEDVNNSEVSVDSLGVISLLNFDDIYAKESLSSDISLKSREEAALKSHKELRSSICEHEDEWLYPMVYMIGHERHWHFSSMCLFMTDYNRNTFTYLNSLKETDTVRLFFNSTGETDYYVLQCIAPIHNALLSTKASTISMCYSPLCPMDTIIAFSCKAINVGEFGSVSFQIPDFIQWGRYGIFKDTLISIYEKLVTRGALTLEELNSMKDNVNTIIRLNSAELSRRLTPTPS